MEELRSILFVAGLFGFGAAVRIGLHLADKYQTLVEKVRELENQVSQSNQ